MPATFESSLPILGQEVAVGRVDKALKELWGADDARTKASLMNFAIYSEDPASLESNTRLLAEITREHACRGLLVLALPGDTPRARAWITAHCQLHDGSKSVCSEQISFILEGGHGNMVRNIVFAHLDSDLPLVLWWQGDLTASFDERFYSEMHLLFLDSSSWSDPLRDFARVLTAHQAFPHFRAYDLSWLRSHYFRTALATCFQDPAALAEIPRLRTLEITHSPGHRLAALLLVAWVGVRLKASLQTHGPDLSFRLPGGQNLAIAVRQSDGEEALQSLTLASADATFSVSRTCGSRHVCAQVEINGSHQHEQILPADLQSDAALITNLLSRLGRQSLYSQMVPMLIEMLAATE